MTINEDKSFEILFYGEVMKMRLVQSRYSIDGSIALILQSYNPDGYWEEFGVITVRLEPLPEGLVALDNNNTSEYFPQIEELFKDNDLGYFTGFSIPSGYCSYPLVKLNLEKIQEFCEMYE